MADKKEKKDQLINHIDKLNNSIKRKVIQEFKKTNDDFKEPKPK